MGLPHVLLRRRAIDPSEAVFPLSRVEAGLPIERFLAGPSFPINRACVVVHRVDARPIDVDRVFERLADGRGVTGSRKRDASEALLADFFRRRGEDRSGIDVTRGELL